MTLQQLHYAITISETGSLNKAAEILYVAQPSLTGAMQELEKELGVTIFHRSGRGVTLTNDGVEFITYARQVYHQYELLMEKYGACGTLKKKFGVSAQHYSFAVKAFVEMVKQFNTAEYEFAIRETQTRTVIEDVSTLRSEIGILYLSSFNRAAITKLLKARELEFHKLIDCRVYAYLWKGHPLAEGEVRPAGAALRVPLPLVRAGREQLVLLCRGSFHHQRISAHHQGQRPRHDAEPDGRAQRLHALLGNHLFGA